MIDTERSEFNGKWETDTMTFAGMKPLEDRQIHGVVQWIDLEGNFGANSMKIGVKHGFARSISEDHILFQIFKEGMLATEIKMDLDGKETSRWGDRRFLKELDKIVSESISRGR